MPDMNIPYKSKNQTGLRFNLEETAGAVGDYGTLLPIAIGVAVVSNIELSHILLFFALWYIITGFYYKLPMPVEPMKAVGAIVIAGSFTREEISAAGIVLGILFLILGFARGMSYLNKKVPVSVVRGIQAGLALILLRTSLGYIVEDQVLSIICILVILLFFIANILYKIPNVSSLLVLIIGIVAGLWINGTPDVEIMPFPKIVMPNLDNFKQGSWLLVLPQAPLTITNAILATSLLFKDTLKANVNPDTISKTTGFMNLTSSILGGFPMCHGAGGLAAQYRFGAKTGGSNLISGFILIPVAVFFSGPQFVSLIPVGVFGALLIFVAFEIGKHSLKTDSFLVTGIVALLALFVNISVGFLVGMILAFLTTKFAKKRKAG
ncbi:MAG: putative sulfate/molybdate transporter [Bacteroidota bacterium]